jgi:catechol 2,3-dioxygenase-like lactoylglutathione lyase family enzyme
MFQQVDYIMITVSNMAQSIEFYRDKLGLKLKFESPEWTEFVTGPTTLALHGGGVHSGDKLLNKEKAAGKCTIGFNVPNLDGTYSEL